MLLVVFTILCTQIYCQQNLDIGVIEDQSTNNKFIIGVHLDRKKAVTSYYLGINNYHLPIGSSDTLLSIFHGMKSLYNPNKDTTGQFLFPKEALWLHYSFKTEQLEILITSLKPYKSLTPVFKLRENEFWQMIENTDKWLRENSSLPNGLASLFPSKKGR